MKLIIYEKNYNKIKSENQFLGGIKKRRTAEVIEEYEHLKKTIQYFY